MNIQTIVDLFNNCDKGDTIVTDENVVFVNQAIIPNLDYNQMKELMVLLQMDGWRLSYVSNKKDRPEIYRKSRMKWIEIHPTFEKLFIDEKC